MFSVKAGQVVFTCPAGTDRYWAACAIYRQPNTGQMKSFLDSQ